MVSNDISIFQLILLINQFNMAPFDAAQEQRLAKAIEFHRQNPHIPKTCVAEKYTVDYSALRNRLINGHLPGNSRGGQTARLSSAEDAGLKKYLAFLTHDVRSYQWLQHFDKHTRELASGRYRALVMGGHGSHVSDHFKHYCWRNKIVPFLLLPHSTHLLQPLDVGVFSAMKAHHQNALYESIRFGDFTFDRTDFLAAFQDIHDRTMRRKTVYSGWKKTGLFPFNPEVVLSKMRQFNGFSAAHASQALLTLANSDGAAR